MPPNKVKVLNSSLENKNSRTIEIQIKQEEELDIYDAASNSSEHYTLEYNTKNKVINFIKRADSDEDDINKNNDCEVDGDEYEVIQKDDNESYKSEDDSTSVQEVLEHVCGKCYQSFTSFQRFKAHTMYCKNQNEIAKNIAAMMKNLKTIEQESIELDKKSICFCCKEIFDTAHTGHIRCPKCPKSFKNSPSFERHLCLIHSDSLNYQCNTCNAKCPSSLILKLHEKAHQRGKPFACKLCGEEFTRKYHLNRHLLHSGCKMSTKKQVQTCNVCGKEFHRLDNLRMHLKQHLGNKKKTKDYPCPYCNKTFYGTATLNIHIRTHTGERPFTCDLCNNSFPSNPALRKHRRTHTGERPYQCSECCRAFAAKEILNRHMKTHTGEKPHQCDLCGKRFIQATQLKHHLITHQKRALRNKPFKCRKCKESFRSQELLNQHIQENHQQMDGEKTAYCETCKKIFQNEGGLRRHITRIHMKKEFLEGNQSDDNDTLCKICNEVFENKKSLQFHRLKVHDNIKIETKRKYEELVEIQEEIEEIQGNKLNENEEEWGCQFCYQKFNKNENLLNHMQESHGAVVLTVNNENDNQSTLETELTSNLQKPIKKELENIESENVELIDVVDEEFDDDNNDISEEISELTSKNLATIKINDNLKIKIQNGNNNNDSDTNNDEQINNEDDDNNDGEDDDDDDEDDDKNDYVLIKLKKGNKKSPSPVNEKLLVDNIKKLLDLLIEQDILKKFGYPKAPVDEVLLKVIKNCGYKMGKYDENCDYITKLRDYTKLLFTVVIDNDSIKQLLNNHPIDKVICQVLEMAETD